jgi:16S rRNA (guanine527-N7)-methyltransferase
MHRPRTISAADLAADRATALRLTPVSRETADRLDRFAALLLEWQRTTNLIAPSTIPQLWTRHIADSLQLLELAPQARRWADLGSGAGFPGLVIACALAESPDAAVHLVESNGKKAAFLRAAAQGTAAPAVIHHQRIEDFVTSAPEDLEIVMARALASLDQVLTYVEPLVKRGAQALLLKGQDVEAELTQAAKSWTMQASFVPSKTNPDGRIVVVRALQKRTRVG